MSPFEIAKEASPSTMTEVTEAAATTHPFEADVAKLLHLMVHSVYSDKDVFLRELISNAADACEKLRYEAISQPALLGDDPQPRITIIADADSRRLTLEDNGIGMDEAEMIEALGTIARSGTKAFMDRIAATREAAGSQLIGQFGVGFYSAFMVADRVDVVSRRAGSDSAALWSSDGLGSYTLAPADTAEAPARGTRVILHLKEDAASYTESATIERLVKAQSGHVPFRSSSWRSLAPSHGRLPTVQRFGCAPSRTSPRKNTSTSIAASPVSSTHPR
jgi:molecular chaperone HtpG